MHIYGIFTNWSMDQFADLRHIYELVYGSIRGERLKYDSRFILLL